MAKRILGVRIYTQTSISDSSIGLFDGVFWFSDYEIKTSNPWKSGFIPDNTLGDTDESVDLRPGGGVAQSGGFTVNIANGKNIIHILDSNGIVFINKRGELVETDEDTHLERIASIGVCIDITWKETNIELTFCDVGDFTNTCLSKVLTDADYPNISSDAKGEVAPLTVGYVDKAKAIRVVSKELVISNHDMVNSSDWIPSNETIFPIISPSGNTPTTTLVVHLGTWGGFDTGAALPDDRFIRSSVVGKYLKVVKGQSVGKFRKVIDAFFAGGTDYHLTVKIASAFVDTPKGNLTVTHDKQTWVSFVDIEKKYLAESSECIGFMDQNGSPTTTMPDLYAFSDELKSTSQTTGVISNSYEFRKISPYSGADNSTYHNTLDFDPKHFVSDLDTISSVIMYTPASCKALGDSTAEPSYYNDGTLKRWDVDNSKDLEKYFVVAGTGYALYSPKGKYLGSPGSDFVLDVFTGGNVASNAIDKNATTCAEIMLSSNDSTNSPSRVVLGFLIKPPTISDEFQFDKCYMLVDAAARSDNFDNGDIDSIIAYRQWIGRASEIVLKSVGNKNSVGSSNSDSYQKSMYDEYFGGTDNDYYYYASADTSASKIWYLHGYNNFEMSGISSMADFKKVLECCVLYRFAFDEWHLSSYLYARLYEVAFAFIKTISIKEAIYAPFKGRVYGGTWGGRKTPSALITNPIDWLEYVCRHLNTSYINNRRIEYGIDATPDEQVNTSAAEGGFDWTWIAEPKARTVAFQRFTADDCMTRSLERLICTEFFLARYRDNRGRECVTYVGDPIGVSNVTRHITLEDVPTGTSIGEVEECSATDIASSSITIRYQQNYGDDSFSGIITISHIYEYAYNVSYVTGYSGGLKQALWERAHSLWARFGNSQSKASLTIDLLTIRDESTAVWHLEKYLANQARRRIEVSVHYEKARKWNQCERVTLQLPHQTNNVQIECVIEKKQAIRTQGITVLGLMMFSEPGAAWPSFSDSSVSDSSGSDSSSSVSGSKSSSSDSVSSASGSSVSASSSSDSSDSSTIGVATDHVHISLWNPQATSEILKTNTNGYVGDGELDPKRKAHICLTDASTNTIAPVLRIDHQLTTGSIAAGFGASMEVRTRVLGVPASSEIGRLGWAHSSATDSYFSVHIRNTSICREALRIDTDRKMWFDPAEAGLDTNLYRVAAAQLKTDGSLQIALALGVGTAPDTTSAIGTFSKGQNLETAICLANETNGTSACASIYALAEGANRISLHSASTLCPLYKAGLSNRGMGVLESVNFDGMLINNYSATSMFFGTNNVVRMTIDSAGALRIGSTFEMPTYTDFTLNAYLDGATWKHRATGFAFDTYQNTDGSFYFYNAPSAVAGSAVAFSLIARINGLTAFDALGGTWAGQDTLFVENAVSTAGIGNYGAGIGFGKPGRSSTRAASIVAQQTGSDTDQCGLAIFTAYSTSSTGALIPSALFDHNGTLSIKSQNTKVGFSSACYRDSAGYDAYLALNKSKVSTVDSLAHGIDDDYIGHIEANAVKFDDSGWASSPACVIAFKQDGVAGASYVGGKICFQTSTNAAALTERMTLSSAGSLGLGRYPTQFFDASCDQNGLTYGLFSNQDAGSAARVICAVSSDAATLGIRAHSAAHSGTLAGINKAGLAVLNAANSGGLLVHNESNTATSFSTNATVRLTIAAAGAVDIVKSLSFSEVQSESVGNGESPKDVTPAKTAIEVANGTSGANITINLLSGSLVTGTIISVVYTGTTYSLTIQNAGSDVVATSKSGYLFIKSSVGWASIGGNA